MRLSRVENLIKYKIFTERKIHMKEISFLYMLLILVISPTVRAQQDNYCGELHNIAVYGPFDYLNRANLKFELEIVEVAHFKPKMEKLIGTLYYLSTNFNYTLHAWPNHHRALSALAKLSIREKNAVRLLGMPYPVECYFERAIRWQPKDSTVRSIYGSYLSKVGRANNAIEQLEIAVKLQADNATAHYNLGLLYFDRSNYDKARFHAERAYELDFPLPGLRNKLIKAGKWRK